jgi:CheY-like chemotaxis protein
MSCDASSFVLIAEDDPEDRLLVSDAWKQSQPEGGLSFVSDGEELLETLYAASRNEREARLPDLVVLDLNMPRKDGREALREMRADRILKLLPVVVFSTSNADRDIVAAYRLGANSYLSKPDTFAGLVRIFQALKEYWLNAARLPAVASLVAASSAVDTRA